MDIKCPHCSKKYSSILDACPHCGKRAMTKAETIVYGSIFIAIVIALIWWFVSCTTSCNRSIEESKESDRLYGNEGFAQGIVIDSLKSRLKAPSTSTIKVQDSSFDKETMTYTIGGYVDAQNSFGAMLRKHFTSIVQYVPNKGYKIITLDIQ